MTVATLAVEVLGRIEYDVAWERQRAMVADRIAGLIGDSVLLLEHPPTITLGRGANLANVLLDAPTLDQRGIAVRATDRGGDVTYHGPGQIVGYPIVDLSSRGRDVHRYLRDVELLLIDTLASFGLIAGRSPGATGVWIDDRKIAAIGVHVSRWVTSHGFALNVETDLSGFGAIIPCGIRDRGVTSMSAELGRTVSVSDVVPTLIDRLERMFG